MRENEKKIYIGKRSIYINISEVKKVTNSHIMSVE